METANLQLEAGKYYRTVCGKKAYVAATNPFGASGDGVSDYVVAGFIEGYGAVTWTRDGRQATFTDSPADLVAEWVEPKRIKGWVNVFAGVNPYIPGSTVGEVEVHLGSVKSTKEDCEAAVRHRSDKHRIACIEIDVLEGQGLEGEAGR
jgi:hypothetical protein